MVKTQPGRSASTDAEPLNWHAPPPRASSLALVVVLLFLGIWYSRRMEKTFADVI